ncbi:polysaccharide deacetylase family protein [Salinimicrobium oceani]
MSSQDFLIRLSLEQSGLTEKEKERAKEVYIYDDKDSAILKFILNYKLNYHQQEKIIAPIFNLFFDENEKKEELYMTEAHLKELASKGYLGSHTHSHYPLGLLEPDVVLTELQVSKSYFEKLTNKSINFLAYPYGTEEVCTAEVAELAKKAGYEIGLTTKRGMNTIHENPLLLKRFDCNDLPGGKSYRDLKNEIFN